MANFKRWPRISENQKKDGKGRLRVGCFSLLVAHGRGSHVGHKPEWASLACWPAHPWGGKGVEGPALGLQAFGAADSPRREEAQDLKKSRSSALAYWCSAAWGSAGALRACASCTPGGGRMGTRQGRGRVAATLLVRHRAEMRSPRRLCAAVRSEGQHGDP